MSGLRGLAGGPARQAGAVRGRGEGGRQNGIVFKDALMAMPYHGDGPGVGPGVL